MKYFFIIIIVFLLLLLSYWYNTEEFANESISTISSIYGDSNKKFIANNLDVSNNANINTINVNNSLNFPNQKYTYKIKNNDSGFVISLYDNNNNLINTLLTLDYSGNAIFKNDLNLNSTITANNITSNNALNVNSDLIINGKIKSDINGTKFGWKIWKQPIIPSPSGFLLDPIGPTGPGFSYSDWVVICVGSQFAYKGNATGIFTFGNEANNKWYGTSGVGTNDGWYFGIFMAIPRKSFFESVAI